MKCPRCNAEVQSGANFCPYCGYSLAETGNPQKRVLRIYGYTEWYAITPAVDVYMNNTKIGSVAYRGVMEVELGNDDAYFEFHLNNGGFTRKCHCYVNNTFNGGLQITTNRFWGTLGVKFTMQ